MKLPYDWCELRAQLLAHCLCAGSPNWVTNLVMFGTRTNTPAKAYIYVFVRHITDVELRYELPSAPASCSASEAFVS